MAVTFTSVAEWQAAGAPLQPGHRVVQGDNLEALRTLPDESIGLVYMDPPFNTGKKRVHTSLKTVKDEDGDRTGFKGERYRTEQGASHSYDDSFDDFASFLLPRLDECWRALHPTGTIYIHLDWREVHHIRVALDERWGADHLLNEIIWAYDFGGRPKRKWAPKHDTILVYVKDPDTYYFDPEQVERIPYMAPGLVGKEKAARGKMPTDVWWHTIVGTAAKERTGYPTQKPLGILRRIVGASAPPELPVLDPFGGSGTTGEAAMEHGRDFLLLDQNPDAIAVMQERFLPAE